MRAFLILSALALAGCKTAPPETKVQHVIVPAPVRCVDLKQVPRETPPVGCRFNGDAKHDLEVRVLNAQALRDWGREMRTLLERWVGKTP